MGENEDLRIQDTENEQLKGGVKCAKKMSPVAILRFPGL